MAWVKVESAVARNRKFQIAGPAASWLWLCGLCYCQEGLTDGFIPAEILPFLGVKSAHRLAEALVNAGLWEHCDGGFRVHDYLKHNHTSHQVKGVQDERRKAGAAGGRASWQGRRSVDHRKQATEATNQQVTDEDYQQQVQQTVQLLPNPATATATATEQEHRTAAAPLVSFPQPVEKSEDALPESHPPPPKPAAAKEPSGDNYRTILKLAHEALGTSFVTSRDDLEHAVRAECHRLGIAPHLRDHGQDTALVRACAAAWTANHLQLLKGATK